MHTHLVVRVPTSETSFAGPSALISSSIGKEDGKPRSPNSGNMKDAFKLLTKPHYFMYLADIQHLKDQV